MQTEIDQLTKKGSPDRFGYEWDHYSQILPESKEQLQRWLGPVSLDSFKGLDVMDVGCGMGRNPYWMLQSGARSMTAVDVDERSLNAARSNLSRFQYTTVTRCSVYELDPCELGYFDRVTHIGVLHHLAEPKLAVKKIWGCVKPGGEFIFWVYGKTGNRIIIPFIKVAQFLGSKLPLPVVHLISKIIASFVWFFIRLIPIPVEYYQFIRRVSFNNLVSIVFDQMIPKIANYWDEKEIHEIISGLPDVESVQIHHVQGNSWTAILKKRI